jgi:signal transduction histidine kinase
MPGKGRGRHSLRREVALILAAAVAITSVALSLSAYYLTKAAQDRDALDKALAQSRFNLVLADSMLPPSPQEADYTDLLKAFQIRGDFATLIQAGPDSYVSGPQISATLVTPALASRVDAGRLAYQSVQMDDSPALAVGGLLRSSGPALYFFYPQAARLAQLNSLRIVLLSVGLALALLGVAAGYFLAGRLVAPVRAAGAAAERMSEGDLTIRLPSGRDEFGMLGVSFNRMAENLEARMADLESSQARERRFVADVAHELRTPVAALVGEISLVQSRVAGLASGSAPGELSNLLDMLGGDITRLRQLVDDLLEISRLDAQAAEVQEEQVDLAVFLGQMIAAHAWSRDVRLTMAARPTGVRTDKRRLERILVNLVGNALVHGGPPVGLYAETSVSSVSIAVTDHGPGISPEHLPHVFDRFYKADPSRSSSPGSGLGLAIARENARLLGGDLTVTSIPTETRFVLTLPLNPEYSAQAETALLDA